MNRRGSAMSLALVAGAVVAIFSTIVVSSFSKNEYLQKVDQYRSMASIIKENLLSIVDNDAAWARIVRAPGNPALACLAVDGGNCGAGNFGIIKVYDANGTVVINNAANEGFDISGNRCTSFDAINGHESCIFKFVITANCSGPCGITQYPAGMIVAPSPKIQVQATIQFKPLRAIMGSAVNVTSTQYTFNFIRGNQDGSLAKYCSSLNGIFDAKTNICAAPGTVPADFDCTVLAGPHAWFAGFAADGTPQCANDSKVGVGCSDTTAIVGYMPDGSVVCSGY